MKRLTDGEIFELHRSVWHDVELIPKAAHNLIMAVQDALAEKNKGELVAKYADPFTYIIQCLNMHPYSFNKGECITFIKELRENHVFTTTNQPDRAAELEALLIWALYHHQGSGSPVGQPIRHALGIDQHAQLTDEQIERAKLAASKRGTNSEWRG